MKAIASSALIAIGLAVAAPAQSQTQSHSQTGKVQSALASWLAERGPVEKVTGVAAYVSLGENGPAIESFAGTVGVAAKDPPVTQDTLFQIGSMTKAMTAAVVLNLEAIGRLSLDQTVGDWLPQYAAWKDVPIRRLLDMTAPIPTYSETRAMSDSWVREPRRLFEPEELVQLAYPPDALPAPPPWFYSNTNYILAGMIAAKAGRRPYAAQLEDLIIQPLGLSSTFYSAGPLPQAVTARLAHGYFANPGCAGYQPDCKESWNGQLLGRDMRDASLSWAQMAGGAVANARDTTRWARAIFAGRVVPAKQQKEWLALVSSRTGKPIADVGADDPQGFGLGLARAWRDGKAQWFYEGMTLGYRTLYVWFDEENLMITLQTNSQPPDGKNALGKLAEALHAAVRN